MTIAYPAWWRGFRWDVERLLNDLFTFDQNPSAVEGLRLEPFFAPNSDREAWLKLGNAYLLVHRRGGNLHMDDSHQLIDQSVVDLAALTPSRDESNDLMAYITGVLDAFGDEGGTVHRSTPHRCGLSTTFMSAPGEVVGPQLIQELIREKRIVPATWEIHAAVPRGLPNYREALSLDDE
ncbi:phage tail termination protein [Mycobacterium sp. C3-094]